MSLLNVMAFSNGITTPKISLKEVVLISNKDTHWTHPKG